MVADAVAAIKKAGGRHFVPGAANSSLVCYDLGITNVDPIKEGLLFERFFIPELKRIPTIVLELPPNGSEVETVDRNYSGPYQEDVLLEIRRRSGFTRYQANRFFNALMKRQDSELDTYREKWFAACAANGHKPSEILTIYNEWFLHAYTYPMRAHCVAQD